MDIIIHEVGLRDGLQMESEIVPTITKLQWIETLAKANVDIIQVGSFVNPKVLPQMADTDEIFAELNTRNDLPKNVKFSALILNEKGLERALKANVEMICMGVSASETHSKKNTGMTTSEALERIIAIAKTAMQEGKGIL
jgi:Isopropylmalate/homocitrate/citramalate synthases